MSHIVTITTEIRDSVAAASACDRLHMPKPTHGRFQLYSSQVEGLGIELPGWRYPVVAKTETGQLNYDNFNGRWGNQEHLDRFLQSYAVEKAKIEARRKGHSVIEQQLPGGSIKLTISVRGAA